MQLRSFDLKTVEDKSGDLKPSFDQCPNLPTISKSQGSLQGVTEFATLQIGYNFSGEMALPGEAVLAFLLYLTVS